MVEQQPWRYGKEIKDFVMFLKGDSELKTYQSRALTEIYFSKNIDEKIQGKYIL